jgi:hypothetical protein
MAQLIAGPSGYWASAYGMPPNAEHQWVMWGFQVGDVVDVMAHPFWVAGIERRVQVTDVSSEVDGNGGRRIFFTVRNVGSTWLNYIVDTMILRP